MTGRSTSSGRSPRTVAAPAIRRSDSVPAAPGEPPGPPTARRPWPSSRRTSDVRAEAWGPGAERALASVPALLGLDRPPGPIGDHHRLVTELARRFPGVRPTATGAVLEALVPAILEQKVTGDEARRAWRMLIAKHGEAGAGAARRSDSACRRRPRPSPRLPYYAYHPFGVEQRRAELIRRVAARAAWFEAITDLPIEDAHARLTAMPGIGPWTAAEVAVRALGDPDAVSVGDFHLPNLVAWALAARAARRRRADARAARTVARRASEGRPPAGAQRHPGAALRSPSRTPADRIELIARRGRGYTPRSRARSSTTSVATDPARSAAPGTAGPAGTASRRSRGRPALPA